MRNKTLFYLVALVLILLMPGKASGGRSIFVPTPDKPLDTQINRANTTYEIKYEFDLGGSPLVVPKKCILVFKGGVIKNSRMVFDKTTIVSDRVAAFVDITATGTIRNNEIVVEWFNCNTENSPEVNQQSLRVLVPLAINSRCDIFFATEGVYRLKNHFPVIRNLEEKMIDCHGITIRGKGKGTVLCNEGYFHNGGYHVEDVFNIVNCKNLNVRDLSVEAADYHLKPRFNSNGQPEVSGTNAFSLCNDVEKIRIINCHASNMPTVWYYFPDINYYYHDGGKAFSIQHGGKGNPKTQRVKDIVFENCTAEHCSDAFDIYIEGTVMCERVVFRNGRADNCAYGIYIANREANLGRSRIVFREMNIKDCQVGFYGNYPIGVSITECRFETNNIQKQYPEHFSDIDFVYMLSAHSCSITNNEFIKGNDIEMGNALRVGQSGSADKYTVEDVRITDNNYSGSYSDCVIRLYNPRESGVTRFNRITVTGNKNKGDGKPVGIERPKLMGRSTIE